MNGIKFINLTPHDIIVRTDIADIKIPASGQVARVSENISDAGMLDGIQVVKR
jgi:hypothetical protein